jgi:hypothetical protein
MSRKNGLRGQKPKVTSNRTSSRENPDPAAPICFGLGPRLGEIPLSRRPAGERSRAVTGRSYLAGDGHKWRANATRTVSRLDAPKRSGRERGGGVSPRLVAGKKA